VSFFSACGCICINALASSYLLVELWFHQLLISWHFRDCKDKCFQSRVLDSCKQRQVASALPDSFLPFTTPCLKNVQHCFCQNFVRFPPTLIIFGTKMAKRTELCEVHSFSTAPDSRRRTTVCFTVGCCCMQVNIQVHFAMKHSNECQVYRCSRCSTVFHSEMEWHLHVRVHHLGIARPFRCLFCREAFTTGNFGRLSTYLLCGL